MNYLGQSGVEALVVKIKKALSDAAEALTTAGAADTKATGAATDAAAALEAIGTASVENTAPEGEPSNAVEAKGLYKKLEEVEALATANTPEDMTEIDGDAVEAMFADETEPQD